MVVPSLDERMKQEYVNIIGLFIILSKNNLVQYCLIFLYRDFLLDEFIIECMHNIDSSQMKYPSRSDKKWNRNGI